MQKYTFSIVYVLQQTHPAGQKASWPPWLASQLAKQMAGQQGELFWPPSETP